MAKWSTPRWEDEWDGDPAHVLDAADAVESVLEQLGRGFTTSIDIDWHHGAADETSIRDARETLRFAEHPKGVRVTIFASEGDPAISIHGYSTWFEVSLRATDPTLADRLAEVIRDPSRAAKSQGVTALLDAERATASGSHANTGAGVREAPTPDPVSEAPASERPAPKVGWLEANQGLVAAIGVGVAVIALIVTLILAFL